MLRALLLGAALLAATARPFPHFGAGCARADFRSAGTLIRAERCGPASGRRAVIVLHGCGGFSTFDHSLVADLPRFGITTLDVDYFAPTPPPGTKGYCSVWTHKADLFGTWQRVAADAAASLRRSFARVGAVGWSLGGGVVVAAAAAGGRPFAAIAGFSTGAFHAQGEAGRLPPTILLSGGVHDAIPLRETRPLYEALRAAHVPAELYVYPHGSHDWPGRQGALGIAHAAAFLRRYLG